VGAPAPRLAPRARRAYRYLTPIQVVREQAYLAGLNPIHESEDCLTHAAVVHHPVHGPGRYFVKHYLEGRLPSKGLANEVFGYILAEAAGLSVPEQALIVQLPRERVTEMHAAHATRVSGMSLLAWATLDVGGEALPRDLDVASESLRAWKALPDLIAFDSWVVIPDRSAANLVRRRNRQLVVIDHGHLAGSVCWEGGMLPITEERRHPFLDLWRPGQIPSEVNQRIIVAAEAHADSLARAEPDLNRLMEPLLDRPGDRIALRTFLQERAKSSPARMKRVLHMLA
jgi:hypothetical protein